MWSGLLIVAAEEASSSGPPAALIITAVCTGIAAIITALSLIFRRTGSEPAPAPADPGSRPIGERMAVVEHQVGTNTGVLVELDERLNDLEAWRREHQWTHGEATNG